MIYGFNEYIHACPLELKEAEYRTVFGRHPSGSPPCLLIDENQGQSALPLQWCKPRLDSPSAGPDSCCPDLFQAEPGWAHETVH